MASNLDIQFGVDTPGTRSLRVGRWSEQNACYHLIANVKDKLPLLTGPVADLVIKHLSRLPEVCDFHLLAFVVMPDHVHLLGTLQGTLSISEVMGRWKKHSGREINRYLERTGPFWQAGYYDRRIRNEGELGELVNYVHLNPVTSELVDRPEDWKHSSLQGEYRTRLTGWWKLGYRSQ